jgi:hypothetical protein
MYGWLKSDMRHETLDPRVRVGLWSLGASAGRDGITRVGAIHESPVQTSKLNINVYKYLRRYEI